MTQASFSADELRALADIACDSRLTEDDVARLEQLLCGNAEAQQFYLAHVCVDNWLRRQFAHPVQDFVSSRPSPVVSLLHATLGYFSEGMPLAYLLAAVIVGVGLLIGSRIYVSGPDNFARQSVPLPSPRSATHYPLPTTHSIVGRITGMVDCQWEKTVVSGQWSVASEDRLPSPACGRGAGGEGTRQLQSPVHLRDRFALSSGLMEITYDTGAKVILQGPVTYEVESAAGGYLSLGKLTAKVEKKAEGGGRKAEEATNLPSPFGRGTGGEGGQKFGNHDQSQRALTLTLSQGERGPGTSSPFRLPPSALFAVRTPTATVTDLGTEFGVEVSEDGRTMSHVFRGSVEVQATPVGGEAAIPARVLHENESAIVKKTGDSSESGSRVAVFTSPETPLDFVRTLPKTTLKTLDLVDVVAGGNGFSGQRNRGIDPTTGRTIDASEERKAMVGDGRYHRVEGLSFVDGVFIPDSRHGPVQTDSAGHTFGEFDTAFSETWHSVWAGGAIPAGTPGQVSPTRLGSIDYNSPGHGLLYMHANKGITFDLDAIRRANPGYKLVRFHTVVGNTETAAVLPFHDGTNSKETLFSDDFQSATVGAAAPGAIAGASDPAIGSRVVGTWELRNADASVQVQNRVSPGNPESGAGANKYLAFTSSTSDDSGLALATGWAASSTEEQIVQLSLSIYVPSGPATDVFGISGFMDGLDASGASGRTISVIQCRNGEVKFHNGIEWMPTTLTGKADAWQNLVITADMAAKKYSISLDGNVYSDAYWEGGATTIGCLWMARTTGTVGGKAFLDNLRLQVVPKPSTSKKNAPASASADVWILVDGERRSGRRGLNRDSGANSIVIPIAGGDRFLTLVATDGGNGLYWDSVLFGDPQIEILSTAGRRQ